MVLGASIVAAAMTAWTAIGAPWAVYVGSGDPAKDRGFITKEWTWSDETTITTFTAYGPAEQVNSFDPQDGSTLLCPDCELASSMQIDPSQEVAPE